jgi:hypothetical protein
MASVVQQLPALIGVVVGALASYLVSAATEHRRWERQQSTRWDEKRAQAYVDYGNAVKNVIYKCGDIANSRGLGPMRMKIDVLVALGELGRLSAERSAKWESLLLLGDTETLLAARNWHRLVGEMQVFIRDKRANLDEWEALFVKVEAARTRFYESARRDLGIRGDPLPPGGIWELETSGLSGNRGRRRSSQRRVQKSIKNVAASMLRPHPRQS